MDLGLALSLVAAHGGAISAAHLHIAAAVFVQVPDVVAFIAKGTIRHPDKVCAASIAPLNPNVSKGAVHHGWLNNRFS